MLLYIHNLPHDIRLGRLRSLISEKCGLDDIILDNLRNDGDGKRITVGLIDEAQASLVIAKINGYFFDGKKLQVEMVSKKESSWQHPKMPYYDSSTAAPIPYMSNPNMFQPPMGQNLNASSNLPYYLTQTQTPYDYGNPAAAVPPVTYPVYEQPSVPIWNQMAGFQNQAFNNCAVPRNSTQPEAYAGQSSTNQPTFAPNSQEVPNPQKRDFGALNSSGYVSITVGKRPRFDDQNASNEIGPRRNAGEETRNYEPNRSYNDRSSLPFDNRDRYDSRDRNVDSEKRFDSHDRGRHGDREDRDRSRFDNREREYDSNSRDRRGHDSRSRGHHDNSERSRNDARDSGGYGSDRNNYSERHAFSFGSGITPKNNANRFDNTRTYSNDPNNSSFSKPNHFGNRSGFEPNKNQNRRKNTPNKNKFAQSGSNKSCAGVKKLDQADELLKTLLFPAAQKAIQNMMKNSNIQQHEISVTKLRDLVKTRMRIIMQQGQGNITVVSQLYNLYREQYPATEDPVVLASVMKNAPSKNRAAKGPSSKPQVTGNPANPLSRPLKLNPVPPTERLPKYPNADKNVHKQLKKKGKEEVKDNYEHPVDEKYLTAIDEEMEALRKVFIEACEPSPDEKVEKIRQKIVTAGVEKFLKLIKMQVSKRLTDNFMASLRIYFTHKGPPRIELDNFLKQYNVVSLKKSDKKNFYIATCNNAEGYDKLIAIKREVIAGVTVLFKPLHLLGAPTKKFEQMIGNLQKGDVSNNAGNSQAKSLDNGKPDTNKKSQNTQNVDQESKSTQNIDKKSENTQNVDQESKSTQNIDKKSENTQNVDQESKSTQNIDKKSENTQNVKEEPKDTDNMMKGGLIDTTIIHSIEVDDLEDF